MAKSPLQHSHHIVPTITYVKTFVMLTILMLATIAASYGDFGSVLINNVIAMTIAVTKAFLVIWVFMGIRWGSQLSRLWALAGFIILPLMFIMFQDHFLRYQEQVPSWDGRPDPALPRQMDPKNPNNQAPPVDQGFRPRI